jgi:hypothetical protein
LTRPVLQQLSSLTSPDALTPPKESMQAVGEW